MLAARSHGIGTLQDLADYHRLTPTHCRDALAELVEEGRLVPATVRDWDRPAYLHPEARRPRRVGARALLSPFDPVVWNRDRALRLFGFHYRIEIYTPPAQAPLRLLRAALPARGCVGRSGRPQGRSGQRRAGGAARLGRTRSRAGPGGRRAVGGAGPDGVVAPAGSGRDHRTRRPRARAGAVGSRTATRDRVDRRPVSSVAVLLEDVEVHEGGRAVGQGHHLLGEVAGLGQVRVRPWPPRRSRRTRGRRSGRGCRGPGRRCAVGSGACRRWPPPTPGRPPASRRTSRS